MKCFDQVVSAADHGSSMTDRKPSITPEGIRKTAQSTPPNGLVEDDRLSSGILI